VSRDALEAEAEQCALMCAVARTCGRCDYGALELDGLLQQQRPLTVGMNKTRCARIVGCCSAYYELKNCLVI
jgi:hypothetical protein